MKPGESITQNPARRSREENDSASAVNDSREFTLDQYTMVAGDVTSYYIYKDTAAKRPGGKQEPVSKQSNTVSIPVWLGKIIEVAVRAQNRTKEYTEDGFPRVSHHYVPDSDLLEDDERGLVSRLMRQEFCHRFVARVLGLLPVLPSPKESEADLAAYYSLSFAQAYSQKESLTPEHQLREYYIDHKDELPAACRILSTGAGQKRISHSFIILGQTSAGQLLCFEKMNGDSMPYRICTIEDIAKDWPESGFDADGQPVGESREWQTVSLGDIMK